MATKQKPQDFKDMLREDLSIASEPARARAAPFAAVVQRRGKEAVLDTDDVQIIVYEMFPDRP